MKIEIRADGLETAEFEKFAIELVKRKFKNKNLHGFTEGRDNGIDGIDDMISPNLILQAKRWKANKTHTSAVKELKEEIDKIACAKIKFRWTLPFKYVIVTSLDLTPNNLQEIRNYADIIIPKAILSDDCIIFASSLTTLSQDNDFKDIFEYYKLIEPNFYKILNNIKTNSIEIESEDYFLDYDFNYFVETSFLGDAYSILQKEHILLIQGPAGIGKTTTCAMLGNLFLNNKENKFHTIVRRIEDINNVLDLYNTSYRNHSKKNLFVIFDDFLGRNKFEVGERVLDDVKKIYSASKNSQNLFICLNSRTQILQNALTTNYEFQKLIDEKINNEKNLIIDLSKYSNIDKANIFRKTFENRLSTLKDDEKIELIQRYNSLIKKNSWNKIIGHANFFPRLIEVIVKNFQKSEDNFYEYVLYFLKHPTQLYNNLFQNLTKEEKYLLFSLLSFDELPIPEEWLKNSLDTLDLSPTFDIQKSLDKLDGSWISFVSKNLYDQSKIDFYNPSIIDFLTDKIKDLPRMKKNIINNSVYLHQIWKDYHYSFYDKDAENMFLTNLLKNWDIYLDKLDFIGQKLLAIIKLGQYRNYKMEFLDLLLVFNGIYVDNPNRNQWSDIITSIYFSSDKQLQDDFIDMLIYTDIAQHILNSSKLNFEDIDNIASYIDDILEYEITDQNFPNSFSELECYSLFRDKKRELLQDYLNDIDTVYNNVSTINLDFNLDSDLDLEIEQAIYKINKNVNINEDGTYNVTRAFYKWQDIDRWELDYSELEESLRDYFEQEFEDLVNESDSVEYNRDIYLEMETMDSILNVPLK